MISRFLSPDEWQGFIGKLALRLAFGGSMLFFHGIPKLQAWSEKSATFPDPMGIGNEASMALTIFAEAFCAALVVLGGLTRFALIPLIIAMGTAFFVIHGSDPYNVKELAFLYLAAFTAMFFIGPGRLSVDSLIGRK
jgi:putative oxidoreductase